MLIVSLLLSCAGKHGSDHWMVSQHADRVSFSFDEPADPDCAEQSGLWSGTVTLHGVDHETLWASTSPARQAVAMATPELVDRYDDLFGDSGPPEAILTWAEARRQHAVALRISAPQLDGDSLRYDACAVPLRNGTAAPKAQPVPDGRVTLHLPRTDAPVTSVWSGPPEHTTSGPIYMTFSGGGWHSHTAMSGWISGMVEASGQDLGDVLGDVEAIGANSGGSWFLSQLAWSEDFDSALLQHGDTWSTTGYLGLTRALFDKYEDCSVDGWITEEICELVPQLQQGITFLSLVGSEQASWTRAVTQLTYAPFGMNEALGGVPLSGARQPWSAGKDLVFSSSLMTDRVALAQHKARGLFSRDQLYEIAPADGLNFLPMYFASIDSGRAAPALLGVPSVAASYFTSSSRDDPDPATIAGGSPADVGVLDAAIASSAAPALVASEDALKQGLPWYADELIGETAYLLRDLAPPLQVAGGDCGAQCVTFPGAVPPASYKELRDGGYLRAADGGYLDNTASAYLLRYLQDSAALVDGFSLVLFMNASSTDSRAPQGTQSIPESVAVLFGYDPGQRYNKDPLGDGAIWFCEGSFCIQTRSPQVFDAAAWDGAAPTWRHSEDRVELRYFELDVTTVANEAFGIAAGVTGTVHLFTNEYRTDADHPCGALPTSEAVFDAYDDVYRVTRSAVRDHSGWEHLARVLRR